MTGIILGYPCSPVTAEPHRLIARQVWAVAQALGKQLAEDPWQRRLDAELVAERTEMMSVNSVVLFHALDVQLCFGVQILDAD